MKPRYEGLRSGVFDGDDVLGLRPCIGERHPRFESRQLLLDAVLSARERLIITCNGADLTTNREMPLVVPLAELLDVVGRVVPLDKHHGPVVVRHPRHGFNERALQPGTLVPGAATPFTFDPAMLQAAVARRGARSAWSGPTESRWLLPPAIVQSVDLQQLIDAVTNPSKVYLRDRLDVRLPDEAEDAEDGLSLSVSPLAKSSLGRSLLEVYRAGDSIEEWFEAARLDGTLPPGELHRAALDEVNAEVKALVDLAESIGVPLAGGERVPDGAQRLDVVAHAADGFGPRHREPALDVLSDLRAEAQLEATLPHLGEVPRRVGHQHRTTHEGEDHTARDPQACGCLQREQRHHEPVVHRLGHVQRVVAQRLDSTGIGSHVGKRHTIAHPRYGFHRSDASF